MSSLDFRIVIPARYESVRLPGKALLDIAGKPMIQHAYERALESGAKSVLIATDNSKIQAVAKAFGAEVCMTSKDHHSGSERIAEAASIMQYDEGDILVNVQCDEPFISPLVIRQLAEDMAKHKDPDITATLYEYVENKAVLLDPAVVKVVLDQAGFALYFSRSPIPWVSNRDLEEKPFPVKTYLRHVGMYAYRVGFLKQYVGWSHCLLEEKENLEQLRMLYHGKRLHLTIAKESVPPGVNTQEDLDRVRRDAAAC